MTYRDTRTDDPVMGAPAPAVRRERGSERRGWRTGPPGPGMVLGLLGALALLASLFMSWWDPRVHPDDVPVRFLFDSDTTTHHPSLLLVLIPLLVLIVVGSLMPGGAVLRIVAGIGTLVVVALFVFQVDDLITGADTIDVLDTGVYVAAIGGVLALLSGFMPAWRTRRTTDRYVDARDGYVDAR